MSNLSKNLKYLRNSKGLSLRQLSENVNINRQSLHDYEKESIAPGIDNLSKIAKFYNVTIDLLVNADIEKIDLNKKDGTMLTNNDLRSIIKDLTDQLEQRNDNLLKELEETKEITSYTIDVLKSFDNTSVFDYIDLEKNIGSLTDFFSDITVNIVKYPKMLKIIKYLNILNQYEDNDKKENSLDKILEFIKTEVEVVTKK